MPRPARPASSRNPKRGSRAAGGPGSRTPRDLRSSTTQIPLNGHTDTSEWIVPAREEGGFSRYLEIVWSGRWIVLLALIAALGGAAFYLARASKVYEAHASLLVTPLPSGSDSLSGLGLIQSSSDPLRDIETGAGFITTTDVAARAKIALRDPRSPAELLTHITASPVAESDTVDVAAKDGSPQAAQRLANAFVTATVSNRTALLKQQLAILIPQLQARLKAVAFGDSATQSALAGQLAQLEALQNGQNPNLRVQALADLPTSPVSPRKTLTIAAAAFGGLVLGIGLVFIVQLLDPRLRREEDLRERFQLPVLARVPRARRGMRRRGGPMFPEAVSPEATDAYRSLRSVLLSGNRSQPDPGAGRIVLVTGPSPSDGKSTTAINLAGALADYSERVTLVEGDIRRPSIGAALGFSPEEGMQSVLNGDISLKDAVTPVETGSTEVQMLLANRDGGTVQPVSPDSLQDVLLAARETSDWVVVDAPPLIYAPDLLTASALLDAVILVVRLGNTNMRNLEELAEMLAQHGVRPLGFVVVGTSGRPDYY